VLERLTALHRNLLRRFAAEEGLQLVHVEILQYLSVCNRYSDSTKAISEYLGQTKGSISQSLGHLENNDFIRRIQDEIDKRIFHFSNSPKGKAVTERLLKKIDLGGASKLEPVLKTLLASIQKKNGLKGFNTCLSCKFNQNPKKNTFVCGLTNERLSIDDVRKICREHESN
jgi:DNA-binding MarR family transcriptional regulator